MEIFENQNPFLSQENFFEGYQQSIKDLRNKPEVIEMDKLCYNIFYMTEDGKRFIELVKERYLIPSLAQKGTPTYQLDVMWAEGFKDFPRMIINALQSHEQRIKAGS